MVFARPKIRKVIKSVIRRGGWDLSRLDSSSSPGLQLVAALNCVQANVVFDIGANTGQFARQLRSAGFGGRIVSFEPQSIAHGNLAAAARSDVAWEIHPRTALGDRNGETDINISGNSLSSSVLTMLDAHRDAAADSAYVSIERAPLVCLDAVAEEYIDPSSRLFVKIDTQGSEWQVLDGAAQTLKLARGLLVELSLIPLYQDQRLWREVIDRIEAEGFTLWAIQKGFTDPRTGRSLQIDAIFLRCH